jgi:hypothetical protein
LRHHASTHRDPRSGCHSHHRLHRYGHLDADAWAAYRHFHPLAGLRGEWGLDLTQVEPPGALLQPEQPIHGFRHQGDQLGHGAGHHLQPVREGMGLRVGHRQYGGGEQFGGHHLHVHGYLSEHQQHRVRVRGGVWDMHFDRGPLCQPDGHLLFRFHRSDPPQRRLLAAPRGHPKDGPQQQSDG